MHAVYCKFTLYFDYKSVGRIAQLAERRSLADEHCAYLIRLDILYWPNTEHEKQGVLEMSA